MLGRPAISVELQRSFWAWIRRGEVIEVAAAAVGVSKTVAWRWFREAGGVLPPQRCEPSSRPARLSFADREEIACRRAAGEGVRAIARAIGRPPSTVSRELARGTRRPKTGYRATVAQALADERARRPKIASLRRDTRLRTYVEGQLELKHSPEQISRRLLIDFPDDPEMRVSHETIYQSLYVQGRGALRRELTQAARCASRAARPTSDAAGMLVRSRSVNGRPKSRTERYRGIGRTISSPGPETAPLSAHSSSEPPGSSCCCTCRTRLRGQMQTIRATSRGAATEVLGRRAVAGRRAISGVLNTTTNSSPG